MKPQIIASSLFQLLFCVLSPNTPFPLALKCICANRAMNEFSYWVSKNYMENHEILAMEEAHK